jgi:MFS family permease
VRGSPNSPPRSRILEAVPLAVAVFLAALDQTVVAVALPSLAEGFSSLDLMPWTVSSYLLTAAIATPVTGRLVDRHGARLIFALSLSLFLIGSLGCGFAPTSWTLVLARAIQGLGGGALGTAALTLVSELAGPDRLGRYQSYFGLLFGFASIAGPPLGGLVTSTVGWRWIFHGNVMIGVVILASVWRRRGARENLGTPVSGTGTATLAVALSGLVALSIWGTTASKTTVVALIVACVLGVAAFFVVERRSAAPLLPLGVLRSTGVGTAAAVGCLSAMGLFAFITYLPAMLQMASSKSPAEAGALMIPFMAAVMASSLWAGRQVDRHGRHWTFIASGTTLAGMSLLAISLLGADADDLLTVACSVVFGAGIGMVMQMVIVTAQKSASPEIVGTATGTVLLLRTVGSLLGVAALGGLLTALVARGLAGIGSKLTADEAADPSIASALSPGLRGDVVDVVGSSYQIIFGIGSGLLLLASAIAWHQIRRG